MKEDFINLLRSTKREGIEDVIKFLEKSDFFQAPASTRYHGCYEGGLMEHSMKVYEIFKEKIEKSSMEINTPQESLIIMALLHQ